MQPLTAMNWLPRPQDFRQALKSAAAAASAIERMDGLVALAQHRLDLVETIQLDNALRALATDPTAVLPRVRVALLSSATIDHLLPGIRVAGLRRRLLLETYKGSFGQYRQELLDRHSTLHAFRPDLILLSLSAGELIGAVTPAASVTEAEQALSNGVSGLRELWRQGREGSGATIMQQTFLDTSEPLFGSFDQQLPGSPARLLPRLNASVADAAAEDGVLLLDVARCSTRDGLDRWFDITRWLQGKIEIAPQAASMYGELLCRVIAAQRGLSKKCLVLDLDNTLWGGVIGDLGLEGIVLGQGSAAGEAHLALQRYAKSLSDRGIILAVCSKNESAIVEAAFREHPEMVLKRSDIAAFAVNWTDKAENLRSIATTLNIGLDSLVFVDDNPAERARIREALPMVAVPELPDDPANYVRCIAEAGYFEAVAFTDEDRQRAGQYSANNEREALRSSFQSMDDFLRGLQMSLVFGPITPIDLARATQLINKTNQFNTTTRRLTADEVAALASSPQNITLQFRLLDRFGDNGLVSVMLLRPDRQDPQLLDMVNWVMSCRVFGRQLEDEAMNIAVEAARAQGAVALRAEFIPTQKNGVISGLFPSLGFTPADAEPGTVGSRWILPLHQYVHRPTFINRGATT
jgi:FkbH-like protein